MASLLDLFTIGFNSDGLKDFEKDLKTTQKNLDDAEDKIDKLETSMSELDKAGKKDTEEFKNLSEELEETKKQAEDLTDELEDLGKKPEAQILNLKKNLGNLTKALGGFATIAIAVRQSMQFYEEANELGNLAEKSNIAVDSLQRLGIAAEKFGSTKEGIAAFAAKLNGKDAEKELENIAAQMEKLGSDAQKWKLAESLGLDEGTTRLLIKGVANYREELKRANKYKLYTKEDIERMRDFQQIQQDIRYGVMNLQAAVARMLLPALTAIAKILRNITDFFVKHEGIIQAAAIFVGIAVAIGATVGAINILNGALAMLMANPVVLWVIAISAAITALILVIEDLIVWANGGESALKKWFKSMGYDVDRMGKDMRKFFDNVVNGWNTCVKAIKEFFNLLKSFEMPAWSQKLLDFYKQLLNIFLHLNSITGPVMFALDKLQQYKLPNNEQPTKDGSHAGGIDYVPNNGYMAELHRGETVLTAREANIFRTITGGTQLLQAANSFPLNAVRPSTIANATSTSEIINNRNKTVTVGKIEVQTQASDGRQLARELTAILDTDNGFVA